MVTASVKPTAFNSALKSVRRARHAYLGVHVMAFEFAQKRAELRLGQLKTFGEYLVSKGEDVETTATESFASAKEKVEGFLPKPDVPVTIELKAKTKAKKAKPTDQSTDITPAAKSAKPTKPAPSKKTETPVDKYAPYTKAVMKYDADLNPLHIKKIVDHLGFALTSRDGKLVACSDPAERETVAKSWLSKKLGIEAEPDVLDAKVSAICDVMKADRMKPRVTFYYLLAKAEGKLDIL